MLASYEGRAALYQVLDMAGVYQTSFCGEETHKTAFREGRRDVGLRLIAELVDVAPNSVTTIMQEAALRHATEKQELEFNDDLE